jgi:structural maintenance of chromosomes protein 6
MDHIQLQVDNPMTVLTQDTARQFLGNSSAGEKYKLFMRGVQLSQLDSDYTIIEEQLSSTEMIMASKQEALSELEQIEHEAKLKVKLFEQSAQFETKVKEYMNLFAWSQVKEKEEVARIRLS